MRESAHEKAQRLVGEGRVTLRVLSLDAIVAAVHGDSARVYDTGWDPSGWWCNCEAHTRCSHIRAVQLVTLEPLPNGAQP